MLNNPAAILVFFPFILQLWMARPLSNDDMNIGDPPLEVTAAEINMQREALELGAPDFRCVVLRRLADVGNETAGRVMLDHLRKEKNDDVLATALQFLPCQDLPDAELEKVAASHAAHANAGVRYQALCLFGRLAANPGRQSTVILEKMAAEAGNSTIRLAAWQALETHPRQVGMDFLRQQLRVADFVFRALAVRVAARHPQSASLREELLQAAADTSPAVRHALAANCASLEPALAAVVVKSLARDPHQAVRAAVAEAIGKLKQPELQQYLLAYCDEDEADIRRLSAAALRHYPNEAALEKLAGFLSDKSAAVRDAAEASAVFMHPHYAVGKKVGSRLADADANTRLRVLRILGMINDRSFIAALTGRLAKEKDPDCLAAAIRALTAFEAASAAGEIAGLCSHDGKQVRAAVAHAIGRLRVPSTFALLNDLAMDGKGKDIKYGDTKVRQEAIHSMGLIGDGALFNKTLLEVLRDVKFTSSVDRSYACWAAPRQKPISKELLARMVVQGTRPVIPMQGSPPSMDSDAVLVSVDFGLVQVARQEPSVRPLAEKVIEMHRFDAAEARRQGKPDKIPGNPNFEPGEDLRAYAKEALDWLNNVEPRPVKRSPRNMDFPYYRIDPDAMY